MIELFRPVERRSSLANPDGWLVDMFGGGASKTGLRVNPDTALSVSAVYSCVQVRAKTLASLPLKLFRLKPDGNKEPAVDHPLYSLLNASPHPDLTRFEFMEMMSGHADLRGNCYAQIVRDNGGRIRRLVPLHPDRVIPRRSSNVTPDGRRPIIYQVSNPGFGGVVELDASQILHVRDFGGDGVIGYSRIRVACESIGIAMAADEHAARMFSNGARPLGVLEHPAKLDDPGRKNLRDSWQAVHGGVSNTGKVAILEEGMKFHQVGMSNEDMQLLDSRKYSRGEIASIFGVPPDRIGAESGSGTYANVEQRQLQFILDCVIPETERWQQRLALGLLTEEEQARYFVRFNLAAMLRGSLLDRYNAYRIALGRPGEPGWITVNDIRDCEDMNRVDGGDNLFTGITPNDPSKTARSLAPLLTDGLARAFRKEAKALRAIVRKSDAAKDAETFYGEHRRYVIEVLAPVCSCARSLGVVFPTAESVADQLISASRSEILPAIADPARVENSLVSWETTRAAAVTADIIERLA